MRGRRRPSGRRDPCAPPMRGAASRGDEDQPLPRRRPRPRGFPCRRVRRRRRRRSGDCRVAAAAPRSFRSAAPRAFGDARRGTCERMGGRRTLAALSSEPRRSEPATTPLQRSSSASSAQPQQALGVPEQAMTRIGEHHVPSLPPKELRTQSGLELLDAGRDVGRHPIEPVRRTQHTAFHRHTSEDVQVFQADPSHIENVIS
jgi:hypothetical protein